MTTANKLTILRLLLIPVMLFFVYFEPLKTPTQILQLPLNQLIFAIIFVIASITDLLDGYIARKYNQITTFGKFLDPIADKVLVLTAMLYLLHINEARMGIWAVMIVIMREFMVTGVRLLAVDKGKVIAASPYGKIKTAATMVALVMFLFNDFLLPTIITDIIWYIAVLFTVISGVDYIWKNKEIVLESI
ncbi:MAG: CDP-diacylglycerol--glycerol-3-phosphate 3-phosphatidyltransferase [Acholeplasmataceae bacterium]